MNNQPIEVLLEVSYFNAETMKSVEYERTLRCKTVEEAKDLGEMMIAAAHSDAYDDGAMMDTFYYELFYEFDEDETILVQFNNVGIANVYEEE